MSHESDFLPLLPSGSGGVRKLLVAWDLTSKTLKGTKILQKTQSKMVMILPVLYECMQEDYRDHMVL